MIFVYLVDKFYPDQIRRRFDSPKNSGKAVRTNAIGTGASLSCGSFVRFSMRIGIEDKSIEEIRFSSNGCGYMIAAADAIADIARGTRLTGLQGLNDNAFRLKIESELGGFDENRIGCLEVCLEALRSALAGFRAAQIEEFRGESALICTCFGVSEETIEQYIEENVLSSVEEVTNICNAGGGCGSCQMLIQEMIDLHRRENI